MDEAWLPEVIRLEERERNFEKAIALLTGIIQKEPSCVEAYIHLAADSGILKKFRQAEHYARTALEIDPKSGRARYYLGCALRDQYRLDEALEELRKAVALLKDSAYAGSRARAMGIDLPLVGWAANVERDFKNLEMRMLLKPTMKRPATRAATNYIPIAGGMKTYRSDRHGFEIDIPEAWLEPEHPELVEKLFGEAPPITDPHDWNQIGCADEAFNFVINPLGMEPPLEDTEDEFTIYAHDHEFRGLEFGRITVRNKDHVWARYSIQDPMGTRWNKKYMIVFGGTEYSITGTCDDAQWFSKRESAWDAIVTSFRLLVPTAMFDPDPYRNYRLADQRREITEKRAMIRDIGGTLYGQAYDACEMGNYSQARALLERCLSENPDHELAHKEMVVVLKALGDKKGALRHRKAIKQLNPSDTLSRVDLVKLLAGCGYRKQAVREVDELIAQKPHEAIYQNLKKELLNNQYPDRRVQFFLSIAFFLFLDVVFWLQGKDLNPSWVAGILCLPAAYYLNLSARWVGFTRVISNWISAVFAFTTLLILVLKGGMQIYVAIPLAILIFASMADVALQDK
jgi:tetratricopeptide (TPR) repeat protein